MKQTDDKTSPVTNYKCIYLEIRDLINYDPTLGWRKILLAIFFLHCRIMFIKIVTKKRNSKDSLNISFHLDSTIL